MKTFKISYVEIHYNPVPNDPFPYVVDALIGSETVKSMIQSSLIQINITTRPNPLWGDEIMFPANFDTTVDRILSIVKRLEEDDYKEFSVSLADHFFNVCTGYWLGLIVSSRSKNLACKFLEALHSKVRDWEDGHDTRVHKGTPYYFLTSIYFSMGDLDSGFASMFKAIREDELSKDQALGLVGADRSIDRIPLRINTLP